MNLRTRRAAAAGVVTFLAVSTAAAVAASPASADGGSTLTVVGTSDVSDSNLVQAVIKPGFEAAYPDVTLNYVPKGTGAAITYAEGGSASALIVHAASVENQFVAGGYSTEKYGRAIFYGDYVLLGKKADAAGVDPGARNDTVTAFEKVAAAGVAGKADFVSRGGTPGTTIQEHAIWALTTGVPTCAVSDANGGGTTPTTAAAGATADPRPACPATVALPSWYQSTGLTQGPNVTNADVCSYPGGGCYVFTDRGTYQYLVSTKSINDLHIVTNNNAKAARGGSTLLVNSFHAYGVNAAKFAGNSAVSINTVAANEFLNYLTSPKAQAAVGAYLANDPNGAPFLPDAAPRISSALPSSLTGGNKITVSGTVSNVVPGTPALSGIKVKVRYVPTFTPNAAGVTLTTTTNAAGKFSVSTTPIGRATYTVSTAGISKVENATLSPAFGDLLQPTSTAPLGPVTVKGEVRTKTLVAGKGVISGSATFPIRNAYQVGSLQLYAAKVHKPAIALKFVASIPVKVDATSVAYRYYLPAGSWKVQLHYVNNGVVSPGVGVAKTVKVA